MSALILIMANFKSTSTLNTFAHTYLHISYALEFACSNGLVVVWANICLFAYFRLPLYNVRELTSCVCSSVRVCVCVLINAFIILVIYFE